MTGCNRLDENIVAGIISMLEDFCTKVDPEIDINNIQMSIDNEITMVKFWRLVMYNTTFNLVNPESDKVYVYLRYVKAYIDYIKYLLKKYKEIFDHKNIDVLINIWLNVVISLAEPKNYTYQFRSIIKLEKYGFDDSETRYISKQLEKYIENLNNDNVRHNFNNLKSTE